MKKRILALIVAALLTSTVFTACGTPAESQSSGSGDTSESSGSQEESGESSSGQEIAPSGEFPLVAEKETLTVFLAQNPNVISYEYDDNALTKYYEDLTNVHVEFQLVPDTDVNTKVNLLLTSQKDLPDIFLSGEFTNEVLTEYGEQGVILSVSDFIEDGSVYYKERLDANQDRIPLITALDGEIYGFYGMGSRNEPNCTSERMWINQTWLDNVDAEIPTTLDEFTNVLRLFKEQDANGNGDPNDEIPFMGATSGWNMTVEDFILGSFLPYTANHYAVYDGEVNALYTDERYQEALRYLKGLVDEGLLDAVTYSQDGAQLKQLTETENRVGVAPGGHKSQFTNQMSDRFNEFVPINPLEGPEGEQWTMYNAYNALPGYPKVVTSACENPELAFKWLDYFYSEDMSMRNRYGVPDVDFELLDPDSGIIGTDGEPAYYKLINEVWATEHSQHWQAAGPGGYNNDYTGARLDPESGLFDTQLYLYDLTQEYLEYAIPIEEQLTPYFYEIEDSERLAEINTTLNEFITDQRVLFITGARDIDADWDAYVEELKSIGYEEVIQIYQERYDEMN